ncbi:hypothetical protein [Leifsonia xyli]|uniref:hypothetical protein n=1 Tax=Leifsonia xyli TaxID=1575 RepID=UPI003D677CDB
MFWAWVVLVLHLLSFVLPVWGVIAIARRVSADLREAVRVTGLAREAVAWRAAKAKEIEPLMGTDQWLPKNNAIIEDYKKIAEGNGLAYITYGDVDVLALTRGRSNLAPLADQAKAARFDAVLVLVGLVFGLAANILPTIWAIPPLVS